MAFHLNVHILVSCLQASDYPERKHNERQENKNTDKTAPEIEITKKQKPDLRQKQPLGTETPAAPKGDPSQMPPSWGICLPAAL